MGDVVTLGMGLWLLHESRRIGVPKRLMLAMTGNVAIDFVGGAVPLVGDAFDFAFKAHARNLKILEKWLAREESSKSFQTGSVTSQDSALRLGARA